MLASRILQVFLLRSQTWQALLSRDGYACEFYTVSVITRLRLPFAVRPNTTLNLAATKLSGSTRFYHAAPKA
jgi:hypothetical protein